MERKEESTGGCGINGERGKELKPIEKVRLVMTRNKDDEKELL